MKMIIRMFCAVALVAGALSLTGCGDKKADAKDTNTVTNAAAKAAKDAKGAAEAAKGAAEAAKDAAKK